MHLSDVIQSLAALIGAFTALYGVIKALPILRDRVQLMRERDAAIMREREAVAAAEAFRLSSEGWQAAVDQLREEVHSTKELLGSAIAYIARVIHSRDSGELPPMPDDLQSLVNESLSKAGGSSL